MIDETFHITPVDVRRQQFPKSMRGYEPERVDHFLQQVAEEMERLMRLNQDLEAKAKGFHEQLRAFRERDKALNDALISAQQLRAEIREQTEREAQLMLREARAEAERMVEQARVESERAIDAARSDVRRIEEELHALARARRGYLAQQRVFVERQLAEIEAAESAPGLFESGGAAAPAPFAGSLEE